MLFNSLAFFIFFPIVACLSYVVPDRVRWLFLLAASSFFYAWFIAKYLLILGGMILVDYMAGLLIHQSAGRRRRMWLLLSLCANLGLLAVFKYWNFALANLTALSGWFGLTFSAPMLHLALPLGLSYHTFQAMAYTVEVYRGAQAPERHLGYFALYVMFFPQLVAGPIERPQHLLPQLRAPLIFEYDRVTSGLRLVFIGLLMKVVVADRFAAIVNPVYESPRQFTGPILALAAGLFTLQIFCDFAGYSYIAIGAARVLNIDLVTNFRHPFLAQSIADYWGRWHISLTTWFRDYVYQPMARSSLSLTRAHGAVLTTFLLCGLWHGANWTYIAWGGLHGMYLILGYATWRARRRLLRWAGLEGHWSLSVSRPLIVFVLVGLSLIFFRASSMADALYIFGHLGAGWTSPAAIRAQADLLPIGRRFIAFALVTFAAIQIIGMLCEREKLSEMFALGPWWLRWSVYYAALLLVWRYGIFGERPFIYFQF